MCVNYLPTLQPTSNIFQTLPWSQITVLLKSLILIFCVYIYIVFAVTKEGAWQTVLQHGEGRPEDPQQGGGGGDGVPLFNIN